MEAMTVRRLQQYKFPINRMESLKRVNVNVFTIHFATLHTILRSFIKFDYNSKATQAIRIWIKWNLNFLKTNLRTA